MNNNIQEDYVSFETAKLLKEKGFDVHCNSLYYDNSGNVSEIGNYNSEDNEEDGPHSSRPSQTLSVKWIRENFGMHIKIDWFLKDDNSIDWDFCIQKIGTDIDEKGNSEYLRDYDPETGFNSPEEATEAALKYVF